ncbi:hypothetical protein D0Z66_18225 [Cereibacter sphaeroides]|nr:hypothetical protein D0Z66_18225 [Cereibacter sphaeroides]
MGWDNENAQFSFVVESTLCRMGALGYLVRQFRFRPDGDISLTLSGHVFVEPNSDDPFFARRQCFKMRRNPPAFLGGNRLVERDVHARQFGNGQATTLTCQQQPCPQ